MRTSSRLIAATAALSLLLAACGGSDGADASSAPDPSDWDAVLAAAEGTTLDLHMFGGLTEINTFVDETYGPRLAELGITLNRVPLADTADAVNAVLGELEADVTSGGSVDLIWINGENFATLRQADAVLTGWSEQLPNASFVDWDDPAIAFDAGLEVEGAESPWGSAQFQFVYDEARTDAEDLPRSFAELEDWIVANPGRFTYPAPPFFKGTRFLKMWFYELTGGHEPWIDAFDEDDWAEASAQLWERLNELKPHLWREGETYPADAAEHRRLFANGEIDLTIHQRPGGIDGLIDDGLLPATSRSYLFDTGTIADHHYLTIPANADAPAAAMVFANMVLEPELQAAKLDPANGWADGIAISPDRVDAEGAATIAAVTADLGPNALSVEQLEAARLPDTVGAYNEAIDRDWDRFVRQGVPQDR